MTPAGRKTATLVPSTIIACLAAISAIAGAAASAAENAPLKLEAKIPLGNVAGRIDHFAIDAKRQHLFIAELGNNTVGVVDLARRSVIHRITGLSEPQGVGYLRSEERRAGK